MLAKLIRPIIGLSGAAFAGAYLMAGDVSRIADIPGPGGCVAMTGVSAGLVNHVPAQSGCAAGYGLRSVHHVTLSADDRFVYAAAGIISGGPPNDDGALTIFERDTATGEFRQLPGALGCLKRLDPFHGLEGCGTARQLIGLRFVTASPDNRFIYTGGYTGIAILRRGDDGRALEQLSGTAGCVSPFQADNCQWVPNAEMVEDISFTADGRFAYAATFKHAVIWFSRDPTTGELRFIGCAVWKEGDQHCSHARGLGFARSVTLSPDEKFAYVPAIQKDTLAIFRRDETTGALEQLPGEQGCISLAGDEGCKQARGVYGPHRLTITRDGRFAYLAGKDAKHQSAVAVFRRDGQTGELTQLDGDAGCIAEPAVEGCAPGRVIKGAHAAQLDTAERTVFVSSDRSEGGIAILDRNPETGVLTQLAGKHGCMSPIQWQGCGVSRRTGGVHIMALTKDGRFAYAASEGEYAVTGYRLE